MKKISGGIQSFDQSKSLGNGVRAKRFYVNTELEALSSAQKSGLKGTTATQLQAGVWLVSYTHKSY